jgi:hypothetical protein
MLTIYHWEPNANSGKPILAALEKGVEFESRYIDMLGFEQHSPDPQAFALGVGSPLACRLPRGRVPARGAFPHC